MPPTDVLDRESSVPLYVQLEEILRAKIAGGEWKPNQRIPSENELNKTYGLSRMTARGVLTKLVGGYSPDRIVVPALELAGAVAIVSAIALLGSIALGTTANGIGVLMIFGAGLLVGLLGSIGDALNSGTLSDVANVASWVLPFEGLYRDALFQLVAEAGSRGGVTGALVQLGPLGGSHDNPALFPLYCVAYAAVVGALAVLAFRRKDL